METSGQPHKSGIIELAANSSVVYLILFFIGAFSHYLYPIPIMSGLVAQLLGVFFLIIGPLFILWSQRSIRRFRREAEGGASPYTFNIGPYRFTRNPTYLGLTFLIAGFGFLTNSAAIVFSAILAFIFVNYTLLRKEERILEEKYGDEYRDYKKNVRRWF